MLRISALVFALALLPAASNPPVITLVGTAVAHDGDTLRIGPDRIRVRLVGIDAPELRQPFGKDARDRLTKIATGGLSCDIAGHDRYGRALGVCFNNNGDDVGALLVRFGLAWCYVKYSNQYCSLEQAARNERVGIWAAGSPQSPWDWRSSHHRP